MSDLLLTQFGKSLCHCANMQSRSLEVKTFCWCLFWVRGNLFKVISFPRVLLPELTRMSVCDRDYNMRNWRWCPWSSIRNIPVFYHFPISMCTRSISPVYINPSLVDVCPQYNSTYPLSLSLQKRLMFVTFPSVSVLHTYIRAHPGAVTWAPWPAAAEEGWS